MCIKIRRMGVTDGPVIAYKVVRKITAKSGVSEYDAHMRTKQHYASSCGETLTYTIGKTVESGDPGIYLYAERPISKYVLRVEIPDGTVIAKGYYDFQDCILAERVKVLWWA